MTDKQNGSTASAKPGSLRGEALRLTTSHPIIYQQATEPDDLTTVRRKVRRAPVRASATEVGALLREIVAVLGQLDPVRGATIAELAAATGRPWGQTRDAVLANRRPGCILESRGEVEQARPGMAPAKLYRLRDDDRVTGPRPFHREAQPGATTRLPTIANRVAGVMALTVRGHGVTAGTLATMLGVGDRSIRKALDDGGYPWRQLEGKGGFVTHYYAPGTDLQAAGDDGIRAPRGRVPVPDRKGG